MAAIALLSLWLCAAGPAAAQKKADPGQFDYYILSLSWSPAWCAHESPRDRTGRSRLQCVHDPALGLIAHGLWPQYNDGTWPEFCRATARLPEIQVEKMLADIPSEALIRHEWERHGTCTGLSVDAFFALLDRGFHAIKPPTALGDAVRPAAVTVAALRDQLVAANPGLRADGVAVVCTRDADRKRIFAEIRICVDKALGFRACDPKTVDSCFGPLSIPAAP